MSSKILIVDDEAPIRALLRSAVSTPGFSVFDADGGRRALEIASVEAPFDLVVTDILMPGMDGFELAEELSRAGHAQQFLFISGYYDAGILTRRLEAFPGAALLSKPFPIPDLLQALHRMLRAENGEQADLRRRA